MREGLILEGINMAISCWNIEQNILLHFDCGVQYRRHGDQQELAANGIQCIMS